MYNEKFTELKETLYGYKIAEFFEAVSMAICLCDKECETETGDILFEGMNMIKDALGISEDCDDDETWLPGSEKNTDTEINETEKADLMEKAVAMIKDNDDLFLDLVQQCDMDFNYFDLDNKGYHIEPMEYFNENFSEYPITDIIKHTAKDFSVDNRFYYYDKAGYIYSTNSMIETYRKMVDANELFRFTLKHASEMYFINDDFGEIVNKLSK